MSHTPQSTDFERLGEERVRTIIEAFTGDMFGDAMIGFFFIDKDHARIRAMEYQHAALFLGADIRYEGRAIAEVHRPLRIMGGQFLRRRKILQNTLEAHRVPADIQARWLAHVDAFAKVILGTKEAVSTCIHDEEG